MADHVLNKIVKFPFGTCFHLENTRLGKNSFKVSVELPNFARFNHICGMNEIQAGQSRLGKNIHTTICQNYKSVVVDSDAAWTLILLEFSAFYVNYTICLKQVLLKDVRSLIASFLQKWVCFFFFTSFSPDLLVSSGT